MSAISTGVRSLVFASAVCLGACATAPREEQVNEQVSARLAEYELTGETRNCLPFNTVRQISAATESKFLVRTGANRFYLNETNGVCFGSTRPTATLIYRTSVSQLCNNELIRVVDQNSRITLGTCALGDFQELRPIASEDEAPAE